MKAYLKRFADLLFKLTSVKGLFAVLFTVLAFAQGTAVWMAFAAWVLFVLGREYFKAVMQTFAPRGKHDDKKEEE
jgi:hypothetical protein